MQNRRSRKAIIAGLRKPGMTKPEAYVIPGKDRQPHKADYQCDGGKPKFGWRKDPKTGDAKPFLKRKPLHEPRAAVSSLSKDGITYRMCHSCKAGD